MDLKQQTRFADLLDERDIKAKALATAVSTDASTVSRWRSGVTPSREMRGRIYEHLSLTEAEIVSLGWDTEDSDA